MRRYDSSQPTPDGQPPEFEEDVIGFYSGYMPMVQGNQTGASQSIEQGDATWAEAHIRSAEQTLQRARADTETRQARQDPDVAADAPRNRGRLF